MAETDRWNVRRRRFDDRNHPPTMKGTILVSSSWTKSSGGGGPGHRGSAGLLVVVVVVMTSTRNGCWKNTLLLSTNVRYRRYRPKMRNINNNRDLFCIKMTETWAFPRTNRRDARAESTTRVWCGNRCSHAGKTLNPVLVIHLTIIVHSWLRGSRTT